MAIMSSLSDCKAQEWMCRHEQGDAERGIACSY